MALDNNPLVPHNRGTNNGATDMATALFDYQTNDDAGKDDARYDWKRRADKRNSIGRGAYRDAYVAEYDRLVERAAEKGIF